MLTGESMPVRKVRRSRRRRDDERDRDAGDRRGTRRRRDAAVADRALVAEAQRCRAPMQKLADQVSAWFVPAVVIVALVTFVAWFFVGPAPRLAHAIVNAVAVLIIACPCALGLATPMSIMVAAAGARSSACCSRMLRRSSGCEESTRSWWTRRARSRSANPNCNASCHESGLDEAKCFRRRRVSSSPASTRLPARLSTGAQRAASSLRLRDFRVDHRPGCVAASRRRRWRSAIGSHASVDVDVASLRRGRVEAERRGTDSDVSSPSTANSPVSRRGRRDQGQHAGGDRALQAEGVRIVMLTGDTRDDRRGRCAPSRDRRQCRDVLPRTEVCSRPATASGRTIASRWPATGSTMRRRSRGRRRHRDGYGHRCRHGVAGVTLVKGDLRGIVRARRLEPRDFAQHPPEPVVRL